MEQASNDSKHFKSNLDNKAIRELAIHDDDRPETCDTRQHEYTSTDGTCASPNTIVTIVVMIITIITTIDQHNGCTNVGRLLRFHRRNASHAQL